MRNILLKASLILSFLIIGKTLFSQVKELTKESDPKVIKEELDKCKSSTDKIYKRWSKGSELIEEEYTLLQGCYTNFSNQIRINEDVMTLISSVLKNGKIKDSQVEGGLVGLKYNVTDSRGNVVGTIKKITGNQYKFNGKRGYTFLKQSKDPLTSEITNTFTQSAQDSVYRALNLKYSTHDITVIAVDNNLNDCKFRIEIN